MKQRSKISITGNIRRWLFPLGLLSTLGLMALSMLVPSTAFASSTTSPTCAATDVQCVIDIGNQYIAQRESSLAKLSSNVVALANKNELHSDQAAAIQSDITTNESALSSLKTKLDAETNATAAREDVRNIFLEFRIYLVVIPRDLRQVHVDLEENLKDAMKDMESTLQAAIKAAPISKQAQLNSLFNDYVNQLAAAETQIDTALTNLPALTPAYYDSNPTSYASTLKTVSSSELAAHTDLHNAARDLHEMAKLLK
ncbi:MAG TPA: hypothetical protein VKR42_08115 [Ktedonobacteraceae bacterium]|nr:hypothetical protein [Ktedonobacteraceae bacterium]